MSRGHRHPEARLRLVRERAAATSDELGYVTGWRFCFGWLVTMKRFDGSRSRYDVPTREEGVLLVRDLYRTDDSFVDGWVIMKGPPERPDFDRSGRRQYPDDGGSASGYAYTEEVE